MAKKRKPDPEERARREAEFREGQRELQARIDYHTAKLGEERARDERRRRRLRRLTFGLLPR